MFVFIQNTCIHLLFLKDDVTVCKGLVEYECFKSRSEHEYISEVLHDRCETDSIENDKKIRDKNNAETGNKEPCLFVPDRVGIDTRTEVEYNEQCACEDYKKKRYLKRVSPEMRR